MLCEKRYFNSTIVILFCVSFKISDTQSDKLFDILPQTPAWKGEEDKKYYLCQLKGIGFCTSVEVKIFKLCIY